MAIAHLIVAALLRRDHRILLVLQIDAEGSGPTWMLPGGVVEPGESVLEALRRELREETGLELSGEPRIAFIAHVVQPDDTHLALTFACEAVGVLAPNDPDGHVIEAQWVGEAEAIARLGRVDWYDSAPLRRHLADRAGDSGPEVLVVDRR